MNLHHGFERVGRTWIPLFGVYWEVGCGFAVILVYVTEITSPYVCGKLVALTDIMDNISGPWVSA